MLFFSEFSKVYLEIYIAELGCSVFEEAIIIVNFDCLIPSIST